MTAFSGYVVPVAGVMLVRGYTPSVAVTDA